jgi:hypothetical protein
MSKRAAVGPFSAHTCGGEAGAAQDHLDLGKTILSVFALLVRPARWSQLAHILFQAFPRFVLSRLRAQPFPVMETGSLVTGRL